MIVNEFGKANDKIKESNAIIPAGPAPKISVIKIS
jgi:hypothetical protein